ncbi:hypothetical protein B0G77_2012 [Paraburkholderia sp. BL10I2N1]|nr:hypothetical protein B0G77_0019 [Paraburkholderia sp. BL10I2N1]TDN68680.1 hypothetical protein B0G77_2012 [Paraburkholderia sp. BL10I2N1]
MNSASTCKAKYAEYVKSIMPDVAFYGDPVFQYWSIYSAIFAHIFQKLDLHIQNYGT